MTKKVPLRAILQERFRGENDKVKMAKESWHEFPSK